MFKIKIYLSLALLVFGLASCTVSYKFTGASVDYTKVKSISIAEFPNNAELVVPSLSQTFTEALKDKYTKQTRLQIVNKGGDMRLEGEIVGYQLSAAAISADSYASETRLTLTVNVRFTNNKIPDESFPDDKKYSSFQMFKSNRMLSDVQDELIKLMVEDIVDQIFNDTAAKW